MKCSNCGADLNPAMRFCPKCGTTVGASTAPTSAETSAVQSPSVYPATGAVPLAVMTSPPGSSAPGGSTAASGPASDPPPSGAMMPSDAAPPPSVPPPAPPIGGPGRPKNVLVFAGIAAAAVLAIVLFLVLKGGGDDKETVLAVPTVKLPTAAATEPATAATSRAGSQPTAAPTNRSGAGAQGSGGKLADLNSYKYSLKIEGTGGPLSDVASTFGALQTGSSASTQGLLMEVTGAYIKPDKSQQTLKLGTFTIDFTTIGKQQWTTAFGIKSGPDTATRSTEDYSFAASIWDEGLLDSFSAFSCSGNETINGVQTKKCGVDASSLSALIDAFGGITGDPSSGIKSISSGSMQAWLAQQGNYPVRISVDLKGKGNDNKDFALKMGLDVTDINSTAIKIDPPK
jgi:hypothetical protein